MLIALSGLPGVGKTTIARELARELSAVHLRIDTIEQVLRDHGQPVHAEGYAIAYKLAEDNLRVGRIVIADSVNPLPLTRTEWHAVASRSDVPVLDVEVICSDEWEHRRRIDTRIPDITNHTLPTWGEVVERDYRPWDEPRLVIDTAAADVRGCVARIGKEVDELFRSGQRHH